MLSRAFKLHGEKAPSEGERRRANDAADGRALKFICVPLRRRAPRSSSAPGEALFAFAARARSERVNFPPPGGGEEL